uniref:Uncharacterized protein n=1 Tax=Oryza punctata TaxID=4537 RepID=A0A0E0JNK0_ORYPU
MAVGKAISASPMVVGEVSRKPLSGMEVEPQRFLCRWERRTRPVCWILAWDPAKAQPASNTKATQMWSCGHENRETMFPFFPGSK